MNVASQLAAVVEAARADTAERRQLAEAAPWDGHTWIPEPCHVARADVDVCVTTYPADAEFIAALDPPTVLRLCGEIEGHYAAAEEILEIHTLRYEDVPPIARCQYDGDEWPCSELRAEAARWGIS